MTAALPTNAAGPNPAPAVVTECRDATTWDTYIRRRPASAYHGFAWKGILERAFGHRAIYLAAMRGDAIVGVLPLVEFRSRLFGRFAVSLPFLNYGGVIADDDEAARSLAGHAVSLAREHGWRHVELRHSTQRFPAWPCRRHKVAMSRRLPADAASLMPSIDRKARNLVRKAEKAGCVVEVGGGELVTEFYRVFARNMRDLGTPVYSSRLFEEVIAGCGDQARVFVVRHRGQPIAASLVVGWRDEVEVPWASSLRTHSDKAPNMLLYSAMLHHAVENGRRVFHFGRSTPGEGTFQFKRQWGAEPTPLVWEYLALEGAPPDQGPTNPKFRAAIEVWRRLPVPIATLLGPHIVRNIP